MSEPANRMWEIFLEVYVGLPRQGPGNRTSTARALKLCTDLPSEPTVLDLGCGTGGQTFHIAELTGGSVTAIDSHRSAVERLNTTAQTRGLAGMFVIA